MKKAVLPGLALVTACLLGCSPQGTSTGSEAQGSGGDPTRIKLVSSLPRTGSANAQTTTIVNGIKMALEEAGWKAGGYDLVYEDWDDASPTRGNWDPALEAQNAEKAVADPDIMVYLGPFNSGAAKISIPTLNRAGVCQISPANTYPGLTKPGKGEPNEPDVYRESGTITYFRVVPADDLQGVVGANWAKKMNLDRVFILHDRELYGKGIADVFRRRAGEIGLQEVGYEGIDVKAANYKALATKIKGSNADLVYFGGVTQSNAGQLMKDIVASGYAGKMMVPDGCFEQAFIDSSGAENLEGRTFVTFGGVPADRLTGKGADFYADYKAKYSSEPEVYAVYGYDAAKVAVEAIGRAGRKDRAAIVAAVAATRDFDGALGRWSFDPNGDTTLTTMSGQIVRGGRFEFVELLGTGD